MKYKSIKFIFVIHTYSVAHLNIFILNCFIFDALVWGDW